MITDKQRYLRQRAREAGHLFCATCRMDAPRNEGGMCDACVASDEKSRPGEWSNRASPRSSGHRRPAL
jgi:predicted amidophosphoribosyltransferase